MTTPQDRFIALGDALNSRYMEREVEVDLAMHAILTGEHYLQIGMPGSAKSAIVQDISRAFKGRFFYQLMDRFTTKEDIFGPPNLKAIKEGQYRRVSDGMLQEAHLAFLDEIFKSSSAVVNAMLTIINERTYKDGADWVTTPLVSVFGASNELPSDREELGAFFDRFLIRRFVSYIREPKNFIKMLHLPKEYDLPELTFEHLASAREEVSEISFPEYADKLMLDIRATLDLEGIVVSDRRWQQSLRLLKASAWLNRSDKVEEQHFQILQHTLWQSPQDIKTVLRTILQHANPLEEKVIDILDALDEIESDLRKAVKRVQADPSPANKKALTENGVEWWTKISDLAKEINGIKKQAVRDGRSSPTIDTAISRVEHVGMLVGADAMGLRNIQGFIERQLGE